MTGHGGGVFCINHEATVTLSRVVSSALAPSAPLFNWKRCQLASSPRGVQAAPCCIHKIARHFQPPSVQAYERMDTK
jgi:hypothetical protein